MKKTNRKAVVTSETPPARPPYWEYGVLVIAISLVVAVRLRLLQVPLERDEGEYAYLGQLILQGIPPYALAGNMKLPGIYGAYALIMALFGQTIPGIHLGLLVVNVATMILVFLLGKRLFDTPAGVVAGASYGLLSVSPSVLGTAGHATHFVVLPALGAILLLLRAVDTGRPAIFFLSGLLFGLAFVVKQPGILFAVFAASYLVWNYRVARQMPWRSVLGTESLLLLGLLLPFSLITLILWMIGAFDKFWFWMVDYSTQYVSQLTLSQAIETFLIRVPSVIGPSVWLWGLAGIGLTALGWGKQVRGRNVFVSLFVVLSFLAVCPGFYFRVHYFILLLPAISILIGLAVSSSMQLLPRRSRLSWLPVGAFILAGGFAVFQQGAIFFLAAPDDVSRIMYRLQPFRESIEIANYIRANSTRADRVAVLGSEPQIYFYANRHSATRHIYTYGLVERQKYALTMQKEMIDEIEVARPRFVVFVDVATSWLVHPQSEQLIFKWFEEYSRRYYDLVGIADIFDGRQTEYRWGNDVKSYSVRGRPLYILQRRDPLKSCAETADAASASDPKDRRRVLSRPEAAWETPCFRTSKRVATANPGTLVKHSIPVKTDHRTVSVPGFIELDLAAHSGAVADAFECRT